MYKTKKNVLADERERTVGFVYDCGMFESEWTTKKGNKERNC